MKKLLDVLYGAAFTLIFGDNSDMECRKLEHLEGLVKDV